MARREPLCVGCRQHPVDPAWRPFCSERCKLVDLDRWLSGGYRVPEEDPRPPAAAPDEDDDGENP